MDTSPRWNARTRVTASATPAIRRADARIPDTEKYVRVTIFLVPFTAIHSAPGSRKRRTAHIQIFVPVDNERTIFCNVFFSQDGTKVDEAETRRKHHLVPGVDLDRNWYKLANEDNWFNQDREAMKNGSYTGILEASPTKTWPARNQWARSSTAPPNTSAHPTSQSSACANACSKPCTASKTTEPLNQPRPRFAIRQNPNRTSHHPHRPTLAIRRSLRRQYTHKQPACGV